MVKEILIGVVAGVLLASPQAFAQSLGNDGAVAATTEPTNPGPGLLESTIEPVEVQLPEAVLERLVGKYTSHDKSVIVVTRTGNRLMADLAGLSLEFSPSGPGEFFIHGSPLTLSFPQGETGKTQGLVVRENGGVIMQASALP